MKKDKELKRFLKKIEKRKKRNDKKNTPLKNPFSRVRHFKSLNDSEFNLEDRMIKLTYQKEGEKK